MLVVYRKKSTQTKGGKNMKPTTEVLTNIYEFAKENELRVTSISSTKYEDVEEFSVKFERGGEE